MNEIATFHKLIAAFNKLVGIRIKTYRENRHWDQADLSVHVGLTRSSVANIETGRQKIMAEGLVGLASAFEMEVTNLIPLNIEVRALAVYGIKLDINYEQFTRQQINEMYEALLSKYPHPKDALISEHNEISSPPEGNPPVDNH